MGCDAISSENEGIWNVSIHAPAWGATFICLCYSLYRRFQFTHPHGVRQICAKAYERAREFQFTHPHGVRHPTTPNNQHRGGVSIHAPAWGATDDDHVPERVCKVSIHAPAWGATNNITFGDNTTDVSIHAPAWGATGSHPSDPSTMMPFQFTHPHGVRLLINKLKTMSLKFQFTHPHGVRPVPRA